MSPRVAAALHDPTRDGYPPIPIGLPANPDFEAARGCRRAARQIRRAMQRSVCLAIAELGISIEGLKGVIGAMLQDDHHARQPIRFLSVNHMTDNRVRTPCARPFGGCGPLFREAAQHSIERRRSPRQYGETFFEERTTHESMLVSPNPSDRVHR